MIRISPPWKGPRAEDIWALYYFLLYKTLPFAPEDYLPIDSRGAYYYPHGDRTKKKRYPTAHKKFKLTKTSQDILSKAKVPAPNTPEELIELVSPQLHQYLYQNHTVQREKLRELLTTETDGKTIQAKKLEFSAKSALSKLLLTQIFNYDSFSRQNLFPQLVQMMGVEVCPYCNRSFTTTVRTRNREYHRQNQVDHYRSKSKFPWFALTLPNLIPACGNCNQKKGDDEQYVLYPYQEEFGEQYQFHTTPISSTAYLMGQMVKPDEFEVTIERVGPSTDPDYDQRVQTSIEKFGLDVLYRESHNAYVCAIFEQRYIFNNAYLDSLIDSFPGLFKSREEARQLLYMKRYDAEGLGAAPLAKLTHDIDEEISRLYMDKKP